ncbi:MAG: hypothetical protein WC742_12565 [Gallionellaceae bacterium]|jgi:hypothetical protein
MTTATDMLAKYLAAELAVLEGKDVSFGDRRLGMVDLPDIRAGRKEWESRVAQESMSTSRVQQIGGLEVKVANFNQEPHSGYPFNRNC